MLFRAGGFAAALLILSASVLSAQPSSVGGHVFVELGRALTTSDAGERQTILPADTSDAHLQSDFLWSVSGGALFGPHWGIGAEWRAPADVVTGFGRAVGSYDETVHERGTFALAIARPAQWPLGTVELVAGPGFIRQHIDQKFTGCSPSTGCTERTLLLPRTLTALTFGVNGVLKVGSRAGLVGFARATSTRRSFRLSTTLTDGSAFVWTYSAGIAIRGWL